MINKIKSLILYCLLISISILPLYSKLIQDPTEYYNVNLPKSWTYKKVSDKKQNLVLVASFKKNIYLKIFHYINNSNQKTNLINYANKYSKSKNYLNNSMRTIITDNNNAKKYFYNYDDKTYYMLSLKKDWNHIYILQFHYADTRLESSIAHIADSFRTTVPTKNKTTSKSFISYIILFVVIVWFAYFFFKIITAIKNIYFLYKIRRIHKKNNKKLNDIFWKMNHKKYIKKLLFNLLYLCFGILIVLFYKPDLISMSVVGIIAFLFAIVEPPDILENYRNLKEHGDTIDDVFDISDNIDIDIDF